jgi:hypothetical protein
MLPPGCQVEFRQRAQSLIRSSEWVWLRYKLMLEKAARRDIGFAGEADLQSA